jgi:hypothetical protein
MHKAESECAHACTFAATWHWPFDGCKTITYGHVSNPFASEPEKGKEWVQK